LNAGESETEQREGQEKTNLLIFIEAKLASGKITLPMQTRRKKSPFHIFLSLA